MSGAVGAAQPAAGPVASFTPFDSPTATRTFTVTPTMTATPTAEAGCAWATFRLASEDDASWMRIDTDVSVAWPPAGGSGPSDVTGDDRVRLMVHGSSDTAAALSVWGEIPPAIAWPSRVERQAAGAWTVDQLAVNNQSTLDLRAIRLPTPPPGGIPWVEAWPHPPCGTEGLRSDLAACDPDVVIMVPEANDAMWPHLFPEQLFPGPEELVAALLRQCDAVAADNSGRRCLVATISKAPYVATWPATNEWIDRANALIRETFPPADVLDFTTGSSNALDYHHVPFAYEPRISHSNQRLHEVRAARALAAVMGSAFSATAAVLQAEARRWNGVSGLAVFGMRWDTSALGDDVEVRAAVLEVRSTYRGAPGALESRDVGLQWANAAAADGWRASDWPAELEPSAYAGAPAIAADEERDRPWSFTLTAPSTVSRTGYTGLFGFVTPSDLPADDTYFTFDVVAADAVVGRPHVCVGSVRSNVGTSCPTGDECTGDAICIDAAACVAGTNPGAPCPLGNECTGGGFCIAVDGAPKLHVYACAPTPSTATATVSSAATRTPPSAATHSAAPQPTRTISPSSPTRPPVLPTPAPPCIGDCDASRRVAIDELIVGVRVALGLQPLERCRAVDASGNAGVEIDELIAAVGNALRGCS